VTDATGGAGERLDAALATRGLARSRTHAARLLAAGVVTVNGRGVVKASVRVGPDDDLLVARLDHYVSRAAHKLLGGLDAFGVDPTGRVGLDVGASTGGFTQVLLERGAREVVALDVGHGQLATPVRLDPRVTMLEGVNARYLTREQLLSLAPVAAEVDLVVADLSFISLTMVLPALVGTLGDAVAGADFVVLVKPQFEVGRQGVREGLVLDPRRRAEALTGVLWAAHDLGLGTAGVISSPVVGSAGNQEYVVHLSARTGTNPTQWLDTADEVTGA